MQDLFSRLPRRRATVAGILCLSAVVSWADEPVSLPDLTVQQAPLELSNPQSLAGDALVTDTAEYLRRSAGGQVNQNGPLSSIAQYRGLYGSRLNVSVDGMPITSGGPNWMDPPLHYAPAQLLQSLQLHRGIAPVSTPGESLGGALKATLKRPGFAADECPQMDASMRVGWNSADTGKRLAGSFRLADAQRFIAVSASRQAGKDTAYPQGKIHPSAYQRNFYLLSLGQRLGEHELTLDLRKDATRDTGTPALPMDIEWIDSDMGRIAYQGQIGNIQSELWYARSVVDHSMSNYQLRMPMDPNKRRYAWTSSEGETWGASFRMPLSASELKFGVDGHFAKHDAEIKSPDQPAFFVNNYKQIQRDQYGVFAELDWRVRNAWQLLLGARYNHIVSDAGEVDGTPARMMAGPATLRDRFNAAQRLQQNDNFDWQLQVTHALNPQWGLELGLARKSRAPSYQERYLWLPLESTAGLADRHRYVGQIDLRSEVSHQAELGLQWRTAHSWFAPRAFWREVQDYIQGVPATDAVVRQVSASNGDPNPLQFANVDARLYGADIDMGIKLGAHWQFAAVLNYVRGKRQDIQDNLYRVAPLNAWLSADYQAEFWSAGVSLGTMARQSKVSATNNEEATPGYAVLNLRSAWSLGAGLQLELGLNNALDAAYVEHLGGYNRVMNSDVALGSRLPGAGRSWQAELQYSW